MNYKEIYKGITLRELLTSEASGAVDDLGFDANSLADVPEYVGEDQNGPLFRDSRSGYYVYLSQYGNMAFESPSNLFEEETWIDMVDANEDHLWF